MGEAYAYAGGNIFQTSLNGDTLYHTWDTTVVSNGEPRNKEPTGIAYCEKDDRFYVSNDDRQTVYRYQLIGGQLKAVAWVERPTPNYDPEGVTCDPVTGRIYVVSGLGIGILVYRYDGGFIEDRYLDLVTTAGTPGGVPSDPEGIAFDALSRHLFVVSAPDKAVFEYDLNGVFVKRYDLRSLSPAPVNLGGLGVGPSSGDTSAMSLYIADRGIDNNKDANERDGGVYETRIVRATEVEAKRMSFVRVHQAGGRRRILAALITLLALGGAFAQSLQVRDDPVWDST